VSDAVRIDGLVASRQASPVGRARFATAVGRLAAIAALGWFGWVAASSLRTLMIGPRPVRTAPRALRVGLPEPRSLLSGGEWTLSGSPWSLAFTSVPARPSVPPLVEESKGLAGGMIPSDPLDGELELIAMARSRASQVDSQGPRTRYSDQRDGWAFALVVRTVAGVERLDEGWAAYSSGADSWQVVTIRPGVVGSAPLGAARLLPMPEGTTSIGLKWDREGRPEAEILATDATPSEVASLWSRRGWLIEGRFDADGSTICRKAGDTFRTWAASRGGHGGMILAILRTDD
jgi:hypothetical protein